MQTDSELEVRVTLTIREYARLTRALRCYQDGLDPFANDHAEALEVEHLRTKLAEGAIG